MRAFFSECVGGTRKPTHDDKPWYQENSENPATVVLSLTMNGGRCRSNQVDPSFLLIRIDSVRCLKKPVLEKTFFGIGILR